MGSLTQRFFRKNGAVRLNVHDEFVKVGALFDTCVFNTVGNAQDRGEGSIHDDTADRALAVVVFKCSHVTGLVAAAFFNLELHVKLAAGKVGNDMFRIENLDIVRQIEVCSSDDAFAFFAKCDRNFVTIFKFKDDAFDIQKNVNHVFLNSVNLAVFMNNTCNLSFCRSKTDHGAQKNTAQRIAKSVRITGFKRFHRYGGGIRIAFCSFYFNAARLKESIYRH